MSKNRWNSSSVFGHFTFIHFSTIVTNIVELYFQITEDIGALLIFHFHFVVFCCMLATEFPFPETGKIYLFSLKGEMFLVITFCVIYIYWRSSGYHWKSGKVGKLSNQSHMMLQNKGNSIKVTRYDLILGQFAKQEDINYVFRSWIPSILRNSLFLS